MHDPMTRNNRKKLYGAALIDIAGVVCLFVMGATDTVVLIWLCVGAAFLIEAAIAPW